MITAEQLKAKLTTEDIISLATALQGTDEYYLDAQEHPIFSTCLDHPDGSSFKLYYYPETGLFHCYTASAETYDVFEMVCRAKQCQFAEAFSFVVDFFGFNVHSSGFSSVVDRTALDDWDIFQKVDDYVNKKRIVGTSNEPISENLLEYFFPLAAPEEWIREGIKPDVMRYYGIRIDSALTKIIIPHRNIDGELVGIRGRAYDPIEIADGKKYMPVYIEGRLYNHSLGKNLYGLYENKETIGRLKKVFVCEGEKSVLQSASFYGCDDCWAVATCGSSFSKEQMELLLGLGVEEIVVGYDREFQGGRGDPDTVAYEDKLMKTVAPLLPYVNVSVIMDYDHLLPYKASPTDCGKETFEKLYKSRIKLYTFDHKKNGRKRK